MRTISLIFAVLLCVGAAPTGHALEIDVGGRQLVLPMPEGFAELTPEMNPYYEATRAYIAPANTRFVSLITSDIAAAMLRGEAVDIGRFVNVETVDSLIAASITSVQFNEFRTVMRTQIDEIVASANEQIPELIDQGNRGLSDQLGVEVAIETGGMVPLPAHLDTSNAIANSMYLSTSTTVNGESAGATVNAGTTLILHVRDKVLFIYVYGAEPELEWTREFATRWAGEIVAANPLTEADTAAINRPAQGGIDWDQVLSKAIAGGIIGGIIGLISYVFTRRKKRRNDGAQERT